MMIITSRPDLRPLLLLLLTTSSMASSRRLLSADLESAPPPTASTDSGRGATPYTAPGVLSTEAFSPITAENGEGLDGSPTAVHPDSKTVTSHRPEGSETSGHPRPSTGNETHNLERSSAGTESSVPTLLPVRNSTSGPALPAEVSTPTITVTNSSSGSILPPKTTASTVPKMQTPNYTMDSAVTIAAAPKTTTAGSSQQRTTRQQVTEKNVTSMRSTQTQSTTTTNGPVSHVCSTSTPRNHSLVGRCLVAIASLAALATIFIVTTIVLATKLSERRYRHHPTLLEELDTEMVCISRMPNIGDAERPVPKPRRPRSNGALIPNTEDEDGDDLTLNSFLPDTECAA